jgi:hypothetical protein
MWTCPKCGAQFVTKNMWHSCGIYTVAEFLYGKTVRAIGLYQYFLDGYRKIGPVILHPAKTRISFMVKVRFSGVNRIGKDYIAGGFWLKQRIESPKFHKIEFIPRDNYIHYFKIHDESDIDDEFRTYMKIAYEIGERKHIQPGGNK